MAHHAYIDESGTMDDQEIMTVAMVVLDGAQVAQRLHRRVARVLFPNKSIQSKKKLEAWFTQRVLHYVDLEDPEKLVAANVFASATLKTFVAQHKHDDQSKEHQYKFSVYKDLVKQVLRASFMHFDELEITIAKQGGWQDYGQSFIDELRTLSDEHPGYRKTRFSLASAYKHGLQIADYYAGSSREFLLADAPAMHTNSYEQIRSQIEYVSPVLMQKEG